MGSVMISRNPQLRRESRRAAAAPVARGRTPGRPTQESARSLREGIVNAALQSFVAHGFEASSMQGIARQAKVAKITLYRQFGSKEALFLEVIRQAQIGVRSRIGTMVDDGRPLQHVLREMIEKLYDGYTHPDYLAVMRLVIAEAPRFPRLGRAMLNDSKYVAEPLVEYLQRLKDRGLIVIDSPYDAATQIAGLASGAGRYVLVPPSRHPVSRKHWVESLALLFTQAWRASLD